MKSYKNMVISAKTRLLARIKVDTETGCWNWQAKFWHRGYGRMAALGKDSYTHRIAYQLFRGEIPGDKQLDHLCRNRACCNPEHLEIVTGKENLLRSPLTTSGRKLCKRGHELVVNNLRGIQRFCLKCAAIRAKKARSVTKGIFGEFSR